MQLWTNSWTGLEPNFDLTRAVQEMTLRGQGQSSNIVGHILQNNWFGHLSASM